MTKIDRVVEIMTGTTPSDARWGVRIRLVCLSTRLHICKPSKLVDNGE